MVFEIGVLFGAFAHALISAQFSIRNIIFVLRCLITLSLTCDSIHTGYLHTNHSCSGKMLIYTPMYLLVGVTLPASIIERPSAFWKVVLEFELRIGIIRLLVLLQISLTLQYDSDLAERKIDVCPQDDGQKIRAFDLL